jgi:hypothetical protein
MARTIRYLTYGKDPLLGDVVGLIENDGRDMKTFAADAGVSPSTLRSWRAGKVYRPQRFTVEQVLRSVGKTLTISDVGARQVNLRFRWKKEEQDG